MKHHYRELLVRRAARSIKLRPKENGSHKGNERAKTDLHSPLHLPTQLFILPKPIPPVLRNLDPPQLFPQFSLLRESGAHELEEMPFDSA